MSDPLDDVYHGPVNVTPERIQAWGIWKDNYLTSCISTWMTQGASPEQLDLASRAVAADLASIDSMDWMPIGHAMAWRIDSMLTGNKTYEGSERIEYLRSLRSAETCNRQERVQVLAYQLGVTVQQAGNMAERVESVFGSDKPTSGRTSLYRHFDASGRLLYVGIAKDPAARTEQHRYHSEWFRFVAGTKTEWLANRGQAEVAEREAITSESPVFNQTHNKQNRDAAIAYLFGAIKQASA